MSENEDLEAMARVMAEMNLEMSHRLASDGARDNDEDDDVDDIDDNDNKAEMSHREYEEAYARASSENIVIVDGGGRQISISALNLLNTLCSNYPQLVRIREKSEVDTREFCHIADRVCPRSTACVSWSDDDDGGHCIEIEHKNSERMRNEALADLAGNVIDIVSDVRSGNVKSSPIAALIGRFSAYVDLKIEEASKGLAQEEEKPKIDV